MCCSTLNSNLGGKADLLWTNPSPNTNWSGTQVINVDLTNYNGVLIEFRGSNADDFFTRTFFKKNETGTNMGAGSYSTNRGYSFGRLVYVHNDKIEFSNTYRGDTVGNDVCVPTKVYGVNLTLE